MDISHSVSAHEQMTALTAAVFISITVAVTVVVITVAVTVVVITVGDIVIVVIDRKQNCCRDPALLHVRQRHRHQWSQAGGGDIDCGNQNRAVLKGNQYLVVVVVVIVLFLGLGDTTADYDFWQKMNRLNFACTDFDVVMPKQSPVVAD